MGINNRPAVPYLWPVGTRRICCAGAGSGCRPLGISPGPAGGPAGEG